MKKHFGTVIFEGRLLYLQQDAYLDNDANGEAAYFASAIDEKEEFMYEIKWQIINEDCQDESDACDWDKYYVRKTGYVLK
jgi:hypothetical protein